MVSDDLQLINPFAGEAETIGGVCTCPTVALFTKQTVLGNSNNYFRLLSCRHQGELISCIFISTVQVCLFPLTTSLGTLRLDWENQGFLGELFRDILYICLNIKKIIYPK